MTTKTELSPSGRKVLERAVSKDDGFLFTNSGGLKGGPAIQVRKGLLKAGLIEDAPYTGKGDRFPERGGLALRVTEAGATAIGGSWKAPQLGEVEKSAAEAATVAQKPATQGLPGASAPTTAKKAPTPREGSKQAQLVEMLKRPSGASIAQVCDTFGWQAHTARAAISTLPKKAGVAKPVSAMEGRERIYKLPATA